MGISNSHFQILCIFIFHNVQRDELFELWNLFDFLGNNNLYFSAFCSLSTHVGNDPVFSQKNPFVVLNLYHVSTLNLKKHETCQCEVKSGSKLTECSS